MIPRGSKTRKGEILISSKLEYPIKIKVLAYSNIQMKSTIIYNDLLSVAYMWYKGEIIKRPVKM